MTGPEHLRRAEECLSVLDAERDPQEWAEAVRDGSVAITMQAAQVHATLALAAATALRLSDGALPYADYKAWHDAAGTQEVRAVA